MNQETYLYELYLDLQKKEGEMEKATKDYQVAKKKYSAALREKNEKEQGRLFL